MARFLHSLPDDRLGEILAPERLKLPASPKVLDIKFEDYLDASGDEALDVYLIVEPRPDGQDWDWDAIEPIEKAIHQALRDAGEIRFPYITAGTEADYRTRFLEEEDA